MEQRKRAATSRLEQEARRRTAAACAAFERLPVDTRMALAREAVETRGAELRNAHRDVINVAAGYRSRCVRGQRKVEKEPCVTFMVPRKWTEREKEKMSAARRARELPRELLVYHDVGGARTLCAIPTDIVAATDYRGLKPRADGNGVVLAVSQNKSIAGTVCAIVRRPDAPSLLYAIGCHHVFAMSKGIDPVPEEVIVHFPGSRTAPVLGTLTRFAGIMETAFEYSFDAALIDVTDAAGPLAAAVVVPKVAAAHGHFDIPRDLTILTPHGTRRATFNNEWPTFSEIKYRRNPPITQTGLCELKLEGGDRTEEGDSGSPVVGPGGLLAGMHIASNGGTQAFMIPAYQLLKPFNYGMPGDGPLELIVPPF